MPNADPYSGSFTVPDRLHVDLISFDGDLVTIHASTEGHSAESIARWLGRHPGVEVVARDRSHVCREGINAGAPDALQ
nr:hypothetical protein [Rubrobacteraceae bacterium]